ncbi:MAG TPA: hypothetical protein VNP04_05900 [Alphaproteobacteria bacterium]|nr:hypothetical protein [Alphaproteobacteria bacterium]
MEEQTLVHSMFGQTVFTIGNQGYTWADVVLAAHLWGDWATMEQDVRAGLACLKHMENTGEGPTAAEVQAAAREFRYARQLISAQEAEAWLAHRHLSPETWLAYLQRSVLRQQWSSRLRELLLQYPITAAEVAQHIVSEGICSGKLAEYAQKLAARAAIHARGREAMTAEPPGSATEAAQSRICQLPPLRPDICRLLGLPPERCRERLHTLLGLEAEFERVCRSILTPKTLQDQLRVHGLDWIRLDCHCLMVPQEQMAREALLCVREASMTLAEVAAHAHIDMQHIRWYLEDVEPMLQPYFLAARQGEWLGPFCVGDAYALFWVLDKVMPAIDAPDIRRRAEQRVLRRLIDEAIDTQVRWHSRG